MRRSRAGFEPVSFQLAPMIDMTFLLLVFFMLTTSISRERRRMEVRLPDATESESPREEGDREIINIDGDGKIYIEGDRLVGRQDLERYLRKRYELDPPLRLYVRADRGARGERIKEVIRLAAEAGALDIIFGTVKRDGTER